MVGSATGRPSTERWPARRREGAERGEGIVVDLAFSLHPQARVRWFCDDTTLEPLETLEAVPARP